MGMHGVWRRWVGGWGVGVMCSTPHMGCSFGGSGHNSTVVCTGNKNNKNNSNHNNNAQSHHHPHPHSHGAIRGVEPMMIHRAAKAAPMRRPHRPAPSSSSTPHQRPQRPHVPPQGAPPPHVPPPQRAGCITQGCKQGGERPGSGAGRGGGAAHGGDDAHRVVPRAPGRKRVGQHGGGGGGGLHPACLHVVVQLREGKGEAGGGKRAFVQYGYNS